MGFWDSLKGFFAKQSKTQMDMEYGPTTTMTPPVEPAEPAAPAEPVTPAEPTKDEALDVPAAADTSTVESTPTDE